MRNGFKESAITKLVVYKVAAMIMSYLDDTDYSSSDEDELKDSGILDDLIYRTIISLLHTRYLNARKPIKKSPDFLEICLSDWKFNCPDLFRIETRRYPAQFDKLVRRLKDNEIFSSSSITGQGQIAVDKQLLIVLRRFSTGEKIHSLAMWVRIRYSTVDKITQKVFMAIHSSCLKEIHIPWSVDQERKKAKEWAETKACYTWQGGWCMVDDMFIPLYSKAQYYGDLWFDRKSNYSINV